MKRKPVPLVRIGFFVLAGFLLLVFFIFLIGSKNKLFSSTSEIKARFVTVSGLKKGAQVQMSGINIGSVKDIALPRNARDSVTVTMKVLTDAMKLIHTDSRAIIGTQGLIGEEIVIITMGGDSTVAVPPEATLVGRPPKDITQIYDTLNAAVQEVKQTLGQVNDLATATTQVVQDMHQGRGTIGQMLTNDELYRNTNAMVGQVRQTAQNANVAIDRIATSFNGVTGELNGVVARINRGEGSLGKLLSSNEVYDNVKKTSDNLVLGSYDLRDALSKFSLGAGRFAEVTEAFKHNFLIKGYFEDRGYWDAPEFEMTIDRKIDSLNRLRDQIDQRIGTVHGVKAVDGTR